jgi:hypothetical protein
VLEFIARVVEHLPEPSQQMTRYWGFYANAARGKRRKKADEGKQASPGPRPEEEEDFTRQARLSWAKPEAFSPGTRSSRPRATSRNRAPRPDSLRRPRPLLFFDRGL